MIPAAQSCSKKWLFYYCDEARGVDFEAELHDPVLLSDLVKEHPGEVFSYIDPKRDVLLDCSFTCKKTIELSVRRLVGLPRTFLSAPYLRLETTNGGTILGSLVYDKLEDRRGSSDFTNRTHDYSVKPPFGEASSSSQGHAKKVDDGTAAVFERCVKPKVAETKTEEDRL